MSSQNIDDILKSYSDQNDFGFTTFDSQTVEAQKTEVSEKLKKIEDLILPLLANLHSTAKNDTIYWPNRKEELEKKIKDFLALTRE